MASVEVSGAGQGVQGLQNFDDPSLKRCFQWLCQSGAFCHRSPGRTGFGTHLTNDFSVPRKLAHTHLGTIMVDFPRWSDLEVPLSWR